MPEKLQNPKMKRPEEKSVGKSKTAVVAEAGPGRFERIRSFFEESWAELKKVTWPTRKDTLKTGLAVLILVTVMTIFLGIIDAVLSRLIGWLVSL